MSLLAAKPCSTAPPAIDTHMQPYNDTKTFYSELVDELPVISEGNVAVRLVPDWVFCSIRNCSQNDSSIAVAKLRTETVSKLCVIPNLS